MKSEERIVLPPPGTPMQCPYSDKHQIVSEHYFHHLSVCDRRPKESFYSFLKSFSETEVQFYVDWLTIESANDIVSRLYGFLVKYYHYFASFNADAECKTVAVSAPFLQSQKHAPQLLSLTAHMIPLLEHDQVIVEAGAGTGMLSAYFAWAEAAARRGRRFYLIERAQGFKHKFDRYARREGEVVERIVCDLRAVDFARFCEFCGSSNVLVVGKHLCGHATDCVLQWRPPKLAIALCCHSKANGEMMTGAEFLNNALSPLQIALLYRMTSWQFAWLNSSDDELTNIQKQARSDKIRIGTLFRRVIDICRILWLEKSGYRVKLCKYCDQASSPECFLLVAEQIGSKSDATV